MAEAGDLFHQPTGGEIAGDIGHWMRGFDDLDALARRAVAVAGDHQTRMDRPRPGEFEGTGHLRRCLAGTDDDGSPLGLRRQVDRDGMLRLGGIHGAVEKPFEKIAIHGVRRFGWCWHHSSRMAWCNTAPWLVHWSDILSL